MGGDLVYEISVGNGPLAPLRLGWTQFVVAVKSLHDRDWRRPAFFVSPDIAAIAPSDTTWKGHFMRHSRLVRRVGVAVMSAASLMVAGGAFLTTAGPATAAPGGTNVCMSLSATESYSPGVPPTGTVSGCHQQMSGTWLQPPGPSYGSSQGSIIWQTGGATSIVKFTNTSLDYSGGPCPASEAPPGAGVFAGFAITVLSGPYAGSTGTVMECVDFSGYMSQGIVKLTNYGPITI
jgi:hypothetical protein